MKYITLIAAAVFAMLTVSAYSATIECTNPAKTSTCKRVSDDTHAGKKADAKYNKYIADLKAGKAPSDQGNSRNSNTGGGGSNNR